MEAKLTLYDYRDQATWWHELGWAEEDLRRVPVHEEQDPDQDFLPLPGVTDPQGHELVVYRHDVTDEIWEQLSMFLSRRGRAGGYDRGERDLFSGPQKHLTDWERPGRE